MGKPGFPIPRALLGAAGAPTVRGMETRFPRMFTSDCQASLNRTRWR